MDFPVITACPVYCFEMGRCDAKIGVESLDQLFLSFDGLHKNGTESVYLIMIQLFE